MNTDAALIVACKATPHDDLPRLVLADWLDENGRGAEAESARTPTAWANGWERAAALDCGMVSIHDAAGFAVAVVLVPRFEGVDSDARFLHYRRHPAVLARLGELPQADYHMSHAENSHATPRI